MTRPSHVHAVLFDCFGVVLDNNFAQFISWKRLFDEQGLPFTMVDFQLKASGGTREQGVRQLMGDVSHERFLELSKRKQEIFNEIKEMNPPEVFRGIPELLKALKLRGVITAIVSASRNTKEDLSRVHLTDAVAAVIDPSSAAGEETCDKELYQIALQRLGVQPEQCIVVEDAPTSVKDARDLGMYVIGIATSVPAAALQDAHVIVQGHTELHDLLLRLCTPASAE